MDIAKMISEGKEHGFYVSKQWRKLRVKILQRDHYECQHCKANGVRKIVKSFLPLIETIFPPNTILPSRRWCFYYEKI